MSRIVWDQTGDRRYETGVKNCVLYPLDASGTYSNGVAWNGITSVAESPSGADANDFYADDMKYLTLRGAETFGGTIEAYTFPDEWAICDGSAELVPGVMLGQQARKPFGLCYRTVVGNDVANDAFGYKLHIVYNSTASPSERSYETINDSPEPINFSWEFTSTPINVTGHKAVSCITIDSTKVAADKMEALKDVLYGTENADPRLPLPDELATLLAVSTTTETTTETTTTEP